MTSMRLALVSLLTMLALGVVGCGSSSVGTTSGARNLEAAAVVPADAALYVGVVTGSDSSQWEAVQALLGRFPDGDRLLASMTKELAGEGLDWERDVKPALGPVTAIVLLPGSSDPVAITKPSLRTKLDALLGHFHSSAAAASLEDGWVAVAQKQATVDAYKHALGSDRLADDSTFADAVGDVPEDALASVFVRPGALNFSGVSTPAGAPAPTSGFEWASGSLTAADDGLAVDGTIRMDKAPASYEPTLLRRVPAGAILAVSFHGSDQIEKSITGQTALAPFLPSVEQALGVRLADVLALLRNQGVLYVRPGLPIPEVTLAVETTDTDAALATVDRIARHLAGSFETTEVDGVTAHVLRMDQVRVTWAAFDGTLLLSTGPSALRDFRSDDAKLVDEKRFTAAGDEVGLGDSTAGVAYVDMQRVTELIDGLAGLAGEDVPPELARNLAPIESIATNATADGSGVRFRGFLSVPAR
jgi:hypothetical protein